jgi:cellobiose phosphorylase
VQTALDSAYERLYDPQTRVVKLFDPPFSSGDVSPGYIKGYSPGFRENGGQYTHGAVWLAMGFLISGDAERGYELLHAILPGGRDADVYRAEPYVLAADVYSNPKHSGRGGWTWYTGAAGWFLRVTLEELLGITMKNGELTVAPRLPESWGGYTARIRTPRGVYEIEAQRGKPPTVRAPKILIEN